MTKAEQRAHYLSLRAELSQADHAAQSRAVCNKLITLITERNTSNVHCYLPMGDEINILPVIEFSLQNEITVICPETLPKRKLRNLILDDLAKLAEGRFGTKHPAGENEFNGDYDLIIVPALAVDKQGFRLGYGGGYYDAFLKTSSAFKVAALFSFQVDQQLVLESHDERVDLVLTM